MLNFEELEDVIEEVAARITFANRTGELDSLLKNWGLDKLLKSQTVYETYKGGKIVVIGASEIKENILIGIAKKFGIDESRFEFCLDYDVAKIYSYKSFSITLII